MRGGGVDKTGFAATMRGIGAEFWMAAGDEERVRAANEILLGFGKLAGSGEFRRGGRSDVLHRALLDVLRTVGVKLSDVDKDVAFGRTMGSAIHADANASGEVDGDQAN